MQLEAIKNIITTDLPPNDMTTWPSITLNNRRYVQEKLCYRKRDRRSWIQEHGDYLVRVSECNKERDGEYWCCKYCDSLFASGATAPQSSHLGLKHQIFNPEKEDQHKRQKTSASVIEMQVRGAATVSRRSTTGPALLASAEDVFEESLLNLIINHNLPYTVIESLL
jgi:hypothetical protein